MYPLPHSCGKIDKILYYIIELTLQMIFFKVVLLNTWYFSAAMLSENSITLVGRNSDWLSDLVICSLVNNT